MAGFLGRLLIVDDDDDGLRFWQIALSAYGFRVETAPSLEVMRELVKRYSFDVVLLDLELENEHGMAALPFLLAESPYTRIFILTSHGSIDTAVEAMQKGASGYITKDKGPEAIVHAITSKPSKARAGGNPDLIELFQEQGFIGEGKAFQKLCDTMGRLKDVDSTVIVFGESGTGKEVIARTLHAISVRAAERFAALNCAAIPAGLLESELFGHKKGAFTDAKENRKGVFELCSAGTLLLDEIGDMPLGLQTKILRVLQEHTISPIGCSESITIHTRIIAATHRDLVEEVQAGHFREDLYYRLSVVPIEVPPLRQRKEDIPLLVDHFLKLFAHKFRKELAPPSAAVMRRLTSYDWPGNIRELRNTIERGAVLAKGGQLCLEDLFRPLPWQRAHKDARVGASKDFDALFALSLNEAKQLFEKVYIERMLEETHGNITKAAKRSGRYRSDIYRLMDKYGLSRGKA